MRQLPNPGTYQARRTGAIVVRQEESGSLMAYIPFALIGSEVAFSGNHAACLGTKDGTVQRKTVETFKKIFPDWDGLNPFELEEIPIPDVADQVAEFELADCFIDESYTPPDADGPIQQFKAQWLNPIGGGLPSKEPMTESERKAALTKWGGKFKALSAAPASKPAAKAPASKVPPRAPLPARRGAKKAVREMDQQEVSDLLKAANPDDDDNELAKKFYAAQDEVDAKANGEFKAAQWGQIADILKV